MIIVIYITFVTKFKVNKYFILAPFVIEPPKNRLFKNLFLELFVIDTTRILVLYKNKKYIYKQNWFFLLKKYFYKKSVLKNIKI